MNQSDDLMILESVGLSFFISKSGLMYDKNDEVQ